MDPKIIYEDEEIIVLNKPTGMIVHPDGKHNYPALTAWLDKKYKEYYLVHRIDRETSGILLVAKTEKAYDFLKKQFQNREVQKTYRAFVHGTLKSDRGIIDKPIGSARGGLGPRSATRPHGATRDALTMYRVISRTVLAEEKATYVEVFPKTGRTHQIRVHFSAIGHPILCDTLYAKARPALLGFSRLALHALSLSFKHLNGKKMNFEAPLPVDFVEAEQILAQ